MLFQLERYKTQKESKFRILNRLDGKVIMDKNNIKAFSTYIRSQQTAQQFLYHCYQKIDGVDAEAKSYENSTAFMYYLEHGSILYETGKQLTPVLQPMLFFYGLTHLLKASLLTKRPNYPETTKILAHGVSTRKRKKKQYSFLKDEVKTHHNGLYPYVSEHLFSVKNLPVDTFKMDYLLALIPEMGPLFNFKGQEKMIMVGMIGSYQLIFPTEILNDYHLTAKAFIQRVSRYLPKITSTIINKSEIQIKIAQPLASSAGPFFFELANKEIFFPKCREQFLPISEVMVHYLLLYNLSMLARYETEWWGDLIATKPEIDYPFIIHFLRHTSEKIPFLLSQDLYKASLDM